VPYPSLYRAKAVSIRSGAVEAFVPQVFGETTITITDALGALPNQPTMGWVFFQAGNPEFPVWSAGVSAMGGGGNGNGSGGVDEVWIGPDAPTGQQEMWFDTNAGPNGTLKVLVDGVWQTAVVTSGGGGSGVDEVSVGPDAPTSGTEELWYDTDEGGDLSINYWNTAWGVVGKGTFVAAAISCPAGARTAIATLTCNTVAGRRYIVKLYNNLMTPGIGIMALVIDGVQRPDAPWANTTQNYNHFFASWAPAENLSTGQHTFTAIFDNQSGGAISLYNDGGWFTLEDVGPVARAAVEPALQIPPTTVASGNALGIVAKGSMPAGGAGWISVPVTTPTNLTNELSVLMHIGRRYRIVVLCRAIGGTGNTDAYVWTDAGVIQSGALWHWVAGNYATLQLSWIKEGDGLTHAIRVRSNGGNGAAYTVYTDTGSEFYVEDMGPNSTPALPVPATPPAWTGLALTSPWVGYSGANRIPGVQYRRIGDMVQVRVSVSGGAPGSSICTLPAGFRPPGTIDAIGRDGGGNYATLFNFQIDGTLLWYPPAGAAANTLVLLNHQFSVTP
jgi:hypothetical protein